MPEPADLHQAIQAAKALREYVAVNASVLYRRQVDAMQAGADALEQLQASRDLLRRSLRVESYGSNGHCLYCEAHASEGRHAHCWQCGWQQPGHLTDCPIRAALDLGAAPAQTGGTQRRQVVGYQTADGRLYRPDDIAIIYETPAGGDLGTAPEEAGEA